MTDATPPAGWYADPTGQYEHRYWDGATWTEHVSTGGQQSTHPIASAPLHEPVRATSPEFVQRQVQQQAGVAPAASGTGHVLDEPVLVVNQKAKLLELTNEYAVFDQHGRQLGSVVQVGQSVVRKVIRAVSSYDQFLTHRLELRDARGAVVLNITRPAKLLKSKIVVAAPNGAELGRIVQQNAIGKIRFGLEAQGRELGRIQAENWRAWNFSISDHTGAEIARITKTWEGFAKTMFTTADNYVVQIHRRLDEPLRSLVVAAAVSVDTALKQDARGLG